MAKNYDDIHIPLTIEKHLENYSKCDDKEERYRVLWTTWSNNKNWLSRMLLLVCQSFQSFSIHDASHSEAVLHNIERILGEERISQLSATDAFVILHICYLHDIGMVISHAERKEIVESESFHEMVQELGKSSDERFQKAVENLERVDYENDKLDDEESRAQLYRDKLEVYYSIINLLANYRRKEHGKKGADSLRNGMESNTALGVGFAMSEIPKRIFLTMADCAETHTMPHAESIMELPYRDGGYAYDYMHPRFDAVLLQLGDVLDMDNNRFHPLMRETAGEIPHISEIHERKHASIRKLCINEESILIEADCRSQEELRLIRSEYDMIYNILEVAGYYWAEICPKEVSGCLPALKEIRLLLNGKEIPKELVTARFNISQDKAFRLLEGSNMYQGKFVFLRELLQNAIDATKIQFFIDCMMTRLDSDGTEDIKNYNITDFNKRNSVKNYPIKISFHIMKRKQFSDEYEELKTSDFDNLEGYEVGVLVKVKDYGVGIGKDDILNMAKVAHGSRKEIRKKIPKWLQPTGEFGIGLQSVFTVTSRFYCNTYLRNGEHYRIEFNSGVHGGYINTTPISASKTDIFENDLYGTEFFVFLPYTKKLKHEECMCGWGGEDPFETDYWRWTPLRHSKELISQMILWLDGQIGEALFPVEVSVHGLSNQKLDMAIGRSACNELHRIFLDGDHVQKKEKKNFNENILAWILRDGIKRESLEDQKEDKDCFYLDIEEMKLYLWCEKAQAFARLGVRRFIDEMFEREKAQNDMRNTYTGGAKIYYKGIFLEKRSFVNDAEIIEYIDIKQRLKRSCLNMTRNSLTQEGNRILEEKIYPAVIETARKVTKYIGRSGTYKFDLAEEIRKKISEMIQSWNEQKDSVKAQETGRKIQEYVVAITWLTYFSCIDFAREGQRNFCRGSRKIECRWQRTVDGVLDELDNVKVVKPWGLPYLEVPIEGWWSLGNTTRIESLAYVICNKHRFAVLSQREPGTRSWKQSLLEIDKDDNELEKLRRAESEREFKEHSEKLENIFRNVIRRSKRKNEDSSGKRRNAYEHNYLIGWLLRNIPTQALLMDSTGDIRLNILGYEIPREIYVNDYAKMLIWDRMLERYKERGIERFATIPFMDLKYLSIKEIPSSVLEVRRGYLSHMFQRYMLMPVSGSVLCVIDEKRKYMKDYAEKAVKVYEIIFPDSTKCPDNGDGCVRFYEKLQSYFRDKLRLEEIDENRKKEKIRALDSYCKMTEENDCSKSIEKLKTDLIQCFSEKEDERLSQFLQNNGDLYESLYILLNNPEILIQEDELEEFLSTYWQNSSKRKGIVNYIFEHKVYDVQREDIEECCESLLRQIYCQRIEEVIREEIRRMSIREESGLLFYVFDKKYQKKEDGD